MSLFAQIACAIADGSRRAHSMRTFDGSGGGFIPSRNFCGLWMRVVSARGRVGLQYCSNAGHSHCTPLHYYYYTYICIRRGGETRGWNVRRTMEKGQGEQDGRRYILRIQQPVGRVRALSFQKDPEKNSVFSWRRKTLNNLIYTHIGIQAKV